MELTLADRSELAELSFTYASCADRRDYVGMGEVFASDAVLVTDRGERTGRERIVEVMSSLDRYDATFHHVGQVRHELDPEPGGAIGGVRGETYCIAHHFRAQPDGTTIDRVMFIRYEDTCERAESGAWLITRRQLHLTAMGDTTMTQVAAKR